MGQSLTSADCDSPWSKLPVGWHRPPHNPFWGLEKQPFLPIPLPGCFAFLSIFLARQTFLLAGEEAQVVAQGYTAVAQIDVPTWPPCYMEPKTKACVTLALEF